MEKNYEEIWSREYIWVRVQAEMRQAQGLASLGSSMLDSAVSMNMSPPHWTQTSCGSVETHFDGPTARVEQ